MKMNIEIPDELGAALKAKARAHGVSPDRFVTRVLEEEFASEPALLASAKPLKTGYGLWAKYGIELSAEAIDENRREMFRNFAEDY